MEAWAGAQCCSHSIQGQVPAILWKSTESFCYADHEDSLKATARLVKVIVKKYLETLGS